MLAFWIAYVFSLLLFFVDGGHGGYLVVGVVMVVNGRGAGMRRRLRERREV
jgi:hypothetical protein